MLTKKVCKACVSDWGEKDEDRWNKGIVRCPKNFKNFSLDDTSQKIDAESPPDWCPNAHKHMIFESSGDGAVTTTKRKRGRKKKDSVEEVSDE